MKLKTVKSMVMEFGYTLFPAFRGLYKLFGFKFNYKDFRQGQLKHNVSFDELKAYLKNIGFETNRIAWKCKNEVLNLRKRLENGCQYHIRVFKDRTVAGHYEYAPEFAPVWHWYQRLLKPRRKQFRKILGQFLVFK